MLWLCLHLPRLPLSALDKEPESGPVAVVDQHGAQRWLITDAPHCPAGTTLRRALLLDPELKLRVRRPVAESAALHSLAHWIYRYGQPVTAQIQDLHEPGRLPRVLLWVEIGQSLNLFGGLEVLRDTLCNELLELGHAAQIGCAPTRAAAALRACAGQSDAVFDPHELEAHLAALPLSVLHWPGERLQALQGVGFRSLGDLFAVPRAAFVKRFGAATRLALDRLLGLAPEPFEAIVPPETFLRRFELAAEIEEVERLQFPLRRLCKELQAYLRACDRGLASVSLNVIHAGARETCIHARFVDPHREADRIFAALHERLERDGLPLPARELILIAEDFAEAIPPQSDLLDPRAGQAQQWSAAVDRIRARLGEARVWSPQVREDHRPELAAARLGATTPAASASGRKPGFTAPAVGARPGFLLTEPWPMPPPQLAADPVFERIESGWWDGQDIRRDYTTLSLNGGRAWVYRDLDTQAWFLHGWWS